ncbi:putative ferric-chelate reductase 1 [Anabas testudineus]|uniref:putative ferric-chelate reductase 1 n=1 Tax=Anabas testudineus TaxID=64144 RepID=UPI000E453EF1|nr:putative ferric-chelate reductase 1 [Anabas testudineus]
MDARLVVTVLFVAAVAVNTATAQAATTAPPTTTNVTTNATTTNVTTATTVPVTSSSQIAGIPAANLITSLSTSGCGTQQLCLSQPSSCDPSTNGSCYFVSAQQQNDPIYQFGLSGNSLGYIAVTLSLDSTLGNNDTTYICANSSGSVQFFSAFLNGTTLNKTTVANTVVNGSVNGNKIQCTFNATVPTQTTKVASNMRVAVSTGSFNSSDNSLGPVTFQFNRTVANLSNPNSTVTEGTSNHAITLQHSLTQALLIIGVVLGLAVL